MIPDLGLVLAEHLWLSMLVSTSGFRLEIRGIKSTTVLCFSLRNGWEKSMMIRGLLFMSTTWIIKRKNTTCNQAVNSHSCLCTS